MIRQYKPPRHISEPLQAVVTIEHLNRKTWSRLKNKRIDWHDIVKSDINKVVINCIEGNKFDKHKPVVFRHEGKDLLLIYNK